MASDQTTQQPLPIKPKVLPPEEPEIVAVDPPPAGPKQSRPPPPTSPLSRPQQDPYQPPSAPLSPIIQQLGTTSISYPPQEQYQYPYQRNQYDHYQQSQQYQQQLQYQPTAGYGHVSVPPVAPVHLIPQVLVELPDTSIVRPKPSANTGAVGGENKSGHDDVEGGDVAVLVADDVLLTPGGQKVGREEFEGLIAGKPGAGKEEVAHIKAKKMKDPAVLIEIPKSPSAQAYEVAHSQKLQDQYFNPVFEDAPGDGTSTPLLRSGEGAVAKTSKVEEPTKA